MKSFAFILMLMCAGCTVVTPPAKLEGRMQNAEMPMPPIPPGEGNAQFQMANVKPIAGGTPATATGTVAVPIPVITNVVTALFDAQLCSYAFFDASADLAYWKRIATYDYPTNGAWLFATNVFKGRQQFYRAGVTQ